MATAAEKRRADRERKRLEREARKAAGVPEPALLDKAIVDALRDTRGNRLATVRGKVRVGDQVVSDQRPSMRAVLFLARKALLERGLDRAAVDQALKDRLKTARPGPRERAPSPPPAPPPVAPVDFEAETWACIQSLCAAVEESSPG